MSGALLGGVELGGTKCIAVVGAPGRIDDRLVLSTGAPGETLPALAAWLAQRQPRAIGVGSFGPVDLDPDSPTFGRILAETKRGWAGADVFNPFRVAGASVHLDTDVGAAGLAEARIGAARDVRLSLYITVGTGIGGAWVRDRWVLRELGHPELGHLRLRRASGDGFGGVCAIHGDCAEGLASGPAIAARAGADVASLPDDHPAFEAAASTLGELVAALVVTLPPEAIVLGGGVVTGRPDLVVRIAEAGARALGGYPPGLDLRGLVRPSELGRDAGPMGALLTAEAGSTNPG